MKTIYPTQDATWSINGEGVAVTKGQPVDHPRDDIADYLLKAGAATMKAPGKPGRPAKSERAAPENKMAMPDEDKGDV